MWTGNTCSCTSLPVLRQQQLSINCNSGQVKSRGPEKGALNTQSCVGSASPLPPPGTAVPHLLLLHPQAATQHSAQVLHLCPHGAPHKPLLGTRRDVKAPPKPCNHRWRPSLFHAGAPLGGDYVIFLCFVSFLVSLVKGCSLGGLEAVRGLEAVGGQPPPPLPELKLQVIGKISILPALCTFV